MLNLLIAQMSNTYSNLMANSRPDIIREHFELADEYSRRFIAWPVPLNVILLPIEIVYFLREYEALTCRYPDNTYWQRLDMFLARNISPSEWVEWARLSTSAAGKAHNLHKAKLESCMERARDRALYMNETKDKDSLDFKVDSMAKSIQHNQEMSEIILNRTSTMYG